MTTTYFSIRPNSNINPTAGATEKKLTNSTELENSYFQAVEKLLDKAPSFFEKPKGDFPQLTRNLLLLTKRYFAGFDQIPEIQNIFQTLSKNLLNSKRPWFSKKKTATENLSEALKEINKKETLDSFEQMKKLGVRQLENRIEPIIAEKSAKRFNQKLQKLNENKENITRDNIDFESFIEESNQLREKISKEFEESILIFKDFVDKLPDKLKSCAGKITEFQLRCLKERASFSQNEYNRTKKVLAHHLKSPLSLMYLEEALQKHSWELLAVEEPKSSTPFLDTLQTVSTRKKSSSTKKEKAISSTPFLNKLWSFVRKQKKTFSAEKRSTLQEPLLDQKERSSSSKSLDEECQKAYSLMIGSYHQLVEEKTL